MSNALEQLLTRARVGVSDTERDGLFDDLAVTDDPAAAEEAAATAASLAGQLPAVVPADLESASQADGTGDEGAAGAGVADTGAVNTRQAVRSAVRLLDPSAETDTPPADDGPKLAAAADTEPITRNNGLIYHPRMLGGTADVTALRACRAANIHVLLSGRPGTGKTAVLEAAFGDDLVTFEGHGDAEIGDLVGTYTQETDGTYTWVPGPLPTAMEQGKVLLVDDATLTPSGVLARLYPAMDGRRTIRLREHRGETVTAADGFLVVAAHNPGVPGAVLSEALASRFLLQVEVSSDLQLARELGVDQRAVRIAAALGKLRRDDQITWAPEMRELLGFQKVADTLGVDTAVANLLGLAPDEERAEVAQIVRSWFPSADALAVGPRLKASA